MTTMVVAAALLCGYAFKGWWNWSELVSKPGVTSILRQFRAPPQADSTKFAVMVAVFDNDAGQDFFHVVMEGLKEIHGIQVLASDQTIPSDSSDTEQTRTATKQATSKVLRQSGAQILIWGTVLRIGDARVLKLFWETEPTLGFTEPFSRHEFENSLELPESLRSRLADVLGLIVTRFRYELDTGARSIRARDLLQYILRVDGLIDPEDPHPLMDAHLRTQVVDAQTDAYLALSGQMMSDQPLWGALMRLEKLLQYVSQADSPSDRGDLEFDLGACAYVLGAWKDKPFKSVLLEKALLHFQVALTLYGNEQPTNHSAAAHSAIAFVANFLAHTQLPAPLRLAYLSRSVAAANAALSAYPRTPFFQPVRWLTSVLLGSSLMLIGTGQHDPASLRAAAAVFREASLQISLERWPSGWLFAQYDAAAITWQLWQTGRNVADLLDTQINIRALVNLPPWALGEPQRKQFWGWLDLVSYEFVTRSPVSGLGLTDQHSF